MQDPRPDWAGWNHSELVPPGLHNDSLMGRNKLSDQDQLLSKLVGVRMTAAEHQKLSELTRNSDCFSVGELMRKVVFKREIVTFQKDASLDPVMEELILIRTQLSGVANNINQLTKAFHTYPEIESKLLNSHAAFQAFQEQVITMKRLIELIESLSVKWLQK